VTLSLVEGSYPSHYLRGIRKQDWILPNGQVDTPAFLPDTRTAAQREDRAAETSIAWQDDDGAVDVMLGDTNAAHGVARLPRSGIDQIMSQRSCVGSLSYERRPLPINRYHGNILFLTDSKRLRTMMAAAIALTVPPSEVLRSRTAGPADP
jgi:hypothetical protein